jgi:hypothetical protein
VGNGSPAYIEKSPAHSGPGTESDQVLPLLEASAAQGRSASEERKRKRESR